MKRPDVKKLSPPMLPQCLLFVSTALFWSQASYADIEEVLVTARKRVESVQKIPTAIDTLPGHMLAGLGVRNTDDIKRLFPSLSSNLSTVVNAGFTIRGVGTNNVHVSGQQSIGTIIDGVAAVSPFVSAIALFDMERIEILRGPQNTLYGRNTTGGVVNYYTRKANPADGFNGRADVQAGNGGLLDFEGAVGLNLSDTAAVRLALMSRSFDGIFKNIPDGEDVGKEDSLGGRFSFVWNINETNSIQLSYSKGEAEGDGLISRSIGNLNADGTTPCDIFVNGGESAFAQGRNNCWTPITLGMINGNDYLASQFAAGNQSLLISNPNPETNTVSPYLVNYSAEWGETYNHDANLYDAEFDTFRLKYEHDFGASQLTLLSAYDTTYVLNSLPSDLAGFTGGQEVDFRVWQHEARLTSAGDIAFRWLLGAYFSKQNSEEDTWAHISAPFVAGGLGISPSILIDSEYRNISVYGQIDYDFTDSFSLTAGLRYTDDKLEGQTQKWVCLPGQHNGPTFDESETFDRNYRFANCTDISATLVDNNPIQELSELGWQVGLTWFAAENTMVYGKASKGFKGGAYDNRALDIGSSPIAPEYLTAYEFGFKSDLLDDQLRLNAAGYIYDWKGLQIFAVSEIGGPAQVNIPKTTIKGLEVELEWSPVSAFYLKAGLGLNDSEIKDVTGVPSTVGVEVGYSVTNSPKITFNALATYTIPLNSSDIILQGTYRHRGKSFFIIGEQDTTRASSDPHNWVDARVSYNFGPERRYSLSFWANNLFEEKACEFLPASLPGNVNFGCQIKDQGLRRWGLSMGVKF